MGKDHCDWDSAEIFANKIINAFVHAGNVCLSAEHIKKEYSSKEAQKTAKCALLMLTKRNLTGQNNQHLVFSLCIVYCCSYDVLAILWLWKWENVSIKRFGVSIRSGDNQFFWKHDLVKNQHWKWEAWGTPQANDYFHAKITWPKTKYMDYVFQRIRSSGNWSSPSQLVRIMKLKEKMKYSQMNGREAEMIDMLNERIILIKSHFDLSVDDYVYVTFMSSNLKRKTSTLLVR